MADAGPPSFHGIVGRSAAMQALFLDIEEFAPFDISVLIQGETGTGKELVASAVRGLSGRKGRPYEVVNCATLTRELAGSELFGHERGAFTSANARKQGLLVQAHGGTVFLDEVGELPLDTQSMLLRVLETGELRPLGSTRTIRTDVRVIAATNRDLEEAVGRREFREDLYERLNDVVMQVPPLRERRDDIPLLLDHFRDLYNRQHGFAVTGLTAEAMAAMTGYGWTGNVRALAKGLRQAMIRRKQGLVQLGDLRIARGAGPPPVAEAGGVQPERAPAGVVPIQEERREVALRIAREQGSVTRRQLAEHCGVSDETARRDLSMLARLGLLRPVGKGSATRYVLPEGTATSPE
jgi:DNA-binding NtrC family response regulator